jgi:cytochrome P450
MAMVAAIIVLSTVFGFIARSIDKKKTVPYASAGTFESIREFGGNNAPWFMLKHAREAQSKGRTCYRLPLPISGGLYVVGDPKLQLKILKDPTTDKSPALFEPFNNITGSSESIFTSQNNTHWKMIRKSTAPAFANSQVTHMKEIALKHMENWCDSFEANFAQEKHCFDPSTEMVRITLQIVCEAGFEYNISKTEHDLFVKSMEESLREFCLKQGGNPIRRLIGFMIPEVQQALHACQNVQAFANRILAVYRTNSNKSGQNTLIKLIESNDSLSDKQKTAEIVFYLLAGHDTTGFSIATTLILLTKYPATMLKLRQDTQGLSPDQWSKSSPYFNHVMKEMFRFMSVASAGSIRRVGKDFDAGNDEIIPKGATVITSQIIANRNTTMFIDADTFNPDRWYDATEEMKNAVTPFSAGIRNCIGQSLAMAELETMIPYLLSRFDINLIDEGTTDYFLTLKYENARLKLNSI